VSHSIKQTVFLTHKEALDHQDKLSVFNNYSESYGRGVSKCMTKLKDGSLVSAWASKWEEFRG